MEGKLEAEPEFSLEALVASHATSTKVRLPSEPLLVLTQVLVEGPVEEYSGIELDAVE